MMLIFSFDLKGFVFDYLVSSYVNNYKAWIIKL